MGTGGWGGAFSFTFGEWGKAKWREQVEMIRVTVGPRRYVFALYFKGKLEQKDDSALFLFHYCGLINVSRCQRGEATAVQTEPQAWGVGGWPSFLRYI